MFAVSYSQFNFLLIIKYDIRSNSRSKGSGKTLSESRKSTGGEGGVTNALLWRDQTEQTDLR